MHRQSLAEISQALHQGDISSVELTQHFIDRIKQNDRHLNSFITLSEQRALEEARRADERLANGQAGPLTGIPIAHKDVFCTKGINTTCASKMLDNFIAPYESTVTDNLKQAGMILLGKTNMDEFAMGSSNENSYYGPVHNPWRQNYIPGGSSGGSAAATAAGLAPASTGTDTGGSIRQPASMCGVSGLKPTYGRVSRYGMIAFASSLEQAGPFGQSAQCLAMIMNAMAGDDPMDSTCVDHEKPDYTASLNQPIQGLTIGIPEQFFKMSMDKQTKETVNNALEQLKNQGAHVQTVQLPHSDVALSAYYVIAPAECSSNLARYDGVRFGYRCDQPHNLEDLYKRSRSEGFGEEVKRRIMTGTYALSAGYYDAYYLKAQQIRRLISEDFQKAFKEVDIIDGPTVTSHAFSMESKKGDPVAMYQSDIFTIPMNLAGVPALSIPCGFINQLPVGLQLVGNYFEEAKLLNIAHQYQQQTQWHEYFPEGFES